MGFGFELVRRTLATFAGAAKLTFGAMLGSAVVFFCISVFQRYPVFALGGLSLLVLVGLAEWRRSASTLSALIDALTLQYPGKFPLASLQHRYPRTFALALKRAIDVAAAAAMLALLAPLFLLIAIAIKLTSPGPVFFVQMRYGYRRRLFRMWKFRSMVAIADELMTALDKQNEAEGPVFKIKNDPRITPLGRFLRRTSLDELPQLWNVLLGDMSLVGPRPMSVRDVCLFTEAQSIRRFRVRPGMTGSWQVATRGPVSFEEWMAIDTVYVENWSIWLDLEILLLAARKYTTELRWQRAPG